MLKQKISNLLACYEELASGTPLEALEEKYVHVEVIIAQELFSKGITLKALEEFVRRRNEHIEAMLNQRNRKWSIDEKGKVIVI